MALIETSSRVHKRNKKVKRRIKIPSVSKNTMATLGWVPPSKCSHCQKTKYNSQSHKSYLFASLEASEYLRPDTNESPLELGSLKARLLGSTFTPFTPESTESSPRGDQRPSVVFTRIIWPIKSKPQLCISCRKISPAKDIEDEIDICKLDSKDQERVWGECYKLAKSYKDIFAMYSYYQFNLENIQNLTKRASIDKINGRFLEGRMRNKWKKDLAYNSLKKKLIRHSAVPEPQIKQDIWAKRHLVPRQLTSNPRLTLEPEDLYKDSYSLKTLKQEMRHRRELEVLARLTHKWGENWARLRQPFAEYKRMCGALRKVERLVHWKRELRWTNANRKRGWTGLTHAELPEITHKFVTVGHVLREGRKAARVSLSHLA